jgi:PQQ enzyme repeat
MMRSTLIAALVSAAPMMALAQTADELKNDEKTPGDVLTYGMGYSQNRFSPLTHINRDNVKRLVPAWSYSMADNRGQEAQALVKDGVIYLTDHEKTVALDALSGKQIWKSVIEYPPDTTRVVCCGIVNRGAALFDGKLYRTTLDAHVIALDLKTGKEVWRTKSADPKDGYSMTVAPLVANGVVIAGVAGAEFGTAAISRASTRRAASRCGAPTPFRQRENRARRLGPVTPLPTAAARPGSPAPTTPSSISFSGGPAIPRHGIRSTASAITSTPTRCSPFNPRPARWSGTIR